MLGTIVNTSAIITGSTIGGLVKKGTPKKYEEAMLKACGLAACGTGFNSIISNMGKSHIPVLLSISLVLGAVIGTKLEFDTKPQNIMKKYTKGNLGEGIDTAALHFCIGALAMVRPGMAALKNDYTFLMTNASLDFVTSITFSSTYGIGITVVALILMCWQGSICVLTRYVCLDFFSEDFTVELCMVGGILITATGVGILKIKNSKSLDIHPAILIPVRFLLIKRVT